MSSEILNVFPTVPGVGHEYAELDRAKRVILVADLVESVRLYEANDAQTSRRWRALQASLQSELYQQYNARLVKSLGDGMMLEVASVRNAIALAFAMHTFVASGNTGLASSEHFFLRVGIHKTVALASEHDVYGHGVNVLARLASVAKPGETVASIEARDDLTDRLDADVEDLGECYFKHLTSPVRVFRLHPMGKETLQPAHPLAPIGLTPTIAVLPFTSTRIDSDESHVAQSVFTDQLTNALARCKSLSIIGRMSVLGFADPKNRAHGLQALNANFVVAGQLHATSNRLEGSLELIDVREGRILTSAPLSGSTQELLSVESDLIQDAAKSVLAAIVAEASLAVRTQEMPNIATHQLYLSSIAMMHRFTAADFNRSKLALEELTYRAPRHAQPLAWLARWHVFQVVQRLSHDPTADAARALDLANRALDNDPDSSLALTVLGSAYSASSQDMGKANTLYEQALQINPSESLAWALRSVACSWSDRITDAEHSSVRGLRLTPLDPIRFYYDGLAATAALAAGDYANTVAYGDLSIRANRLYGSPYRSIAVAHVWNGRLDLARQTIKNLLLVEPQSSVAQFWSRAPRDNAFCQKCAVALLEAGLPQQ